MKNKSQLDSSLESSWCLSSACKLFLVYVNELFLVLSTSTYVTKIRYIVSANHPGGKARITKSIASLFQQPLQNISIPLPRDTIDAILLGFSCSSHLPAAPFIAIQYTRVRRDKGKALSPQGK
ncbi:hypothetical protein JQN58_17945 [Aneurinibacillus sp. BA2021]|nr:hypothetical protein [Aneurinibacillus sp. BA2021]